MYHVIQLLDANFICNDINIGFDDILIVTKFVRHYCKRDDLVTHVAVLHSISCVVLVGIG